MAGENPFKSSEAFNELKEALSFSLAKVKPDLDDVAEELRVIQSDPLMEAVLDENDIAHYEKRTKRKDLAQKKNLILMENGSLYDYLEPYMAAASLYAEALPEKERDRKQYNDAVHDMVQAYPQDHRDRFWAAVAIALDDF